jgi:hypothetical protein
VHGRPRLDICTLILLGDAMMHDESFAYAVGLGWTMGGVRIVSSRRRKNAPLETAAERRTLVTNSNRRKKLRFNHLDDYNADGQSSSPILCCAELC